MIELTVENAVDYLRQHGWIADGNSATAALLAGGVSNAVFLITPAQGAAFVLKQSRAQLRTEAAWFSRLDRVYREIEGQRAIAELLPAGAVPQVLFADRENYCYAMSAVCAEHAVWKLQLLSGVVDQTIFRQAGELLGSLHAKTEGRWDLLDDPHDSEVFYQLRVDPFYERVAAVHPSIQSVISRLEEEMNDNSSCLVHADFSPKNLLVHSGGLSLVDFETVHFGDPAFDLGFFFSHLWLKAIAHSASRQAIIEGIQTAWTAYRSCYDVSSTGTIVAKEPPLSSRAVRHLAGCLLARIDGKSPVDYLTKEADQSFVRTVALRWLLDPPENMDSAFAELSESLTELQNDGL